ncbi:MAG: hypothetical protein CSA58_11715 [Micrococcales bacterium]|nr:MAG: hypothetical protein CSA58_11715 [Micrococcales bacterium]
MSHVIIRTTLATIATILIGAFTMLGSQPAQAAALATRTAVPQGRIFHQGVAPQGRIFHQGAVPQGRIFHQGVAPQGRIFHQGVAPQREFTYPSPQALQLTDRPGEDSALLLPTLWVMYR